jgi:hypothetical protein
MTQRRADDNQASAASSSGPLPMSAMPPKRQIAALPRNDAMGHERTHAAQQIVFLFDSSAIVCLAPTALRGAINPANKPAPLR